MLSEISEKPVQNKVITLKLKEFDGMFAEIKKLIEELKVMLSEEDIVILLKKRKTNISLKNMKCS